MGIEAISPSRISYTVRELNPRKYSSNLQDFNNSVDTVNFSGTENNSENKVAQPEKKQNSNLVKGIFVAVGTAIVATGVWFLTRGKGGKEATKAANEVAETIAGSTQKLSNEAAEIIVEASPKGAEDVAEIIVENAPKSAEEIAEVVVESVPKVADDITEVVDNTPKVTEEIVDVVVDNSPKTAEEVTDVVVEELPNGSKDVFLETVEDSSVEVLVPKKNNKKSNKADKAKVNIVPESQKKPSKTAVEEIKPENNDIPAAIILASDDIANGSEKFAGKVKDIAENIETPKLASDDMVALTDEIPHRGMFGQDLNDPLDPRNADDIMSPHYKEKGVFGQDLNDPLDPRNEDDIMSPYYKDRTLEALDGSDLPIIDIVDESIGF